MVDYAFLHGGGQGSWVWKQTITALEAQTGGSYGRALALDVPGCGLKRGRATETTTADEVVAELLAEVRAAGFKDVVLTGHSQAGTLLPLMVGADPTLFRKVVYVSCLAPTGDETTLNWASSLPAAESALTLSGLAPRERFRAMFCNDMPEVAAEAFLDELHNDHWPNNTYGMTGWRYDHLDQVPSTYVICLRDSTLPARWQEVFASRLHVPDLVRIDAGHQVMNTRPHALAEVLRAFHEPLPPRAAAGRLA